MPTVVESRKRPIEWTREAKFALTAILSSLLNPIALLILGMSVFGTARSGPLLFWGTIAGLPAAKLLLAIILAWRRQNPVMLGLVFGLVCDLAGLALVWFVLNSFVAALGCPSTC